MTAALEWGEWSAAHPGLLYPWERPGTHCTGGRVGLRAGLAPPGFDPRTVQLVVSRYPDWATRPKSYTYLSGNGWGGIDLKMYLFKRPSWHFSTAPWRYVGWSFNSGTDFFVSEWVDLPASWSCLLPNSVLVLVCTYSSAPATDESTSGSHFL